MSCVEPEGCYCSWHVQIKGNEMEFMAYGLLYAAVANPKQLPMELRGVPCRAWQHPYMKHALRVTSSAFSISPSVQK